MVQSLWWPLAFTTVESDRSFLLLSLYLHGWSDKRKSLEGWRNQCVTSEAISSPMHKRDTCTRSSNDRQVRKSGNIFDCCIVILITSQWSRHSVHANCLYIVDWTDIEIIDPLLLLCCCPPSDIVYWRCFTAPEIITLLHLYQYASAAIWPNSTNSASTRSTGS
jgi:hypothetical protein